MYEKKYFYEIGWHEKHQTIVEAGTDDAALDKAYYSDPEKTICGRSFDSIKIVGGYCHGHGDFRGEWCEECARLEPPYDTVSEYKGER